jgi:predicted kinase
VAVLDATWGARRERDTAREQAAAWRVPVFFVETLCAPEIAAARLAERERAGGDASDAGPELAAASRLGFEPLAAWPQSRRASVATDAPGWRAELARLAERIRGRAEPAP